MDFVHVRHDVIPLIIHFGAANATTSKSVALAVRSSASELAVWHYNVEGFSLAHLQRKSNDGARYFPGGGWKGKGGRK